MDGLSDGQLVAITAIERACSVLSILGSLFIILTFCFSHSFRKPINRMVFYASFGNLMSNVGTLMSRDHLGRTTSFGCQFQAFLLQLFWPADALWTLAMAINVYLTFYFKYGPQSLRRMELPYIVACYGLPLVPAIVFPFIKNQQGARVYGDATLWCWISSDWGILRVAALYGPVWLINFVIIFIYVRAGRTIYEAHQRLREVHSSDCTSQAVHTLKTTEITITTLMSEEVFRGGNYRNYANVTGKGPDDSYSVHISTGVRNNNQASNQVATLPQDITPKQTSTTDISRISASNTRDINRELNRAALAYTKCSILLFLAMLITWIPSSANRIYSLVRGNEINIPLQFMAAFVLPLQGFWNAVICIATSWSACLDLLSGMSTMRDTMGGKNGNDGTESWRGFRWRRLGSPASGPIILESDSMIELAKVSRTSADRNQHGQETSTR